MAFQYESANNRDKYYRHVSKGGWPFSTSAHGWPISDCTGEGLKAVLVLMKSPVICGAIEEGSLRGIDPIRLQDAVNVILTLQNEDGGEILYCCTYKEYVIMFSVALTRFVSLTISTCTYLCSHHKGGQLTRTIAVLAGMNS